MALYGLKALGEAVDLGKRTYCGVTQHCKYYNSCTREPVANTMNRVEHDKLVLLLKLKLGLQLVEDNE